MELQVAQAWLYATLPASLEKGSPAWQEKVRGCIALFPRVREVSRSEQKHIGLNVLDAVRHEPQFGMEIRRVVVLPT